MRLQKKTVWESVKSWAVIYPRSKQLADDEQIKVDTAIAVEFFTSLEDELSDEEFTLAAQMIKKRSRWFPTIAQVLELKNDVISELSRKANRIALPMDTRTKMSDEESDIGCAALEKMKEISQMDLTPEQMGEKMEEYLSQNRIQGVATTAR